MHFHRRETAGAGFLLGVSAAIVALERIPEPDFWMDC